MNERKQYCTLRVGDLFLGIDVGRIQEVLRDTSFTPVPLSDSSIRGLINLRGQIVTAIDLRRRLGLDDTDDQTRTSTMVLGTAEEPLAVVVDSVGDVVEVDAESFEPPPDTLKGEARRMIDGAHKLERSLLLILNLETVMTLADENGTDE
ncbi:MAG: chemotaxis protein CheW [Thermoanaerobaculales bacterium]|nr:chemotaxis protein CheW [Thermoanaerobaculales bacterium]